MILCIHLHSMKSTYTPCLFCVTSRMSCTYVHVLYLVNTFSMATWNLWSKGKHRHSGLLTLVLCWADRLKGNAPSRCEYFGLLPDVFPPWFTQTLRALGGLWDTIWVISELNYSEVWVLTSTATAPAKNRTCSGSVGRLNKIRKCAHSGVWLLLKNTSHEQFQSRGLTLDTNTKKCMQLLSSRYYNLCLSVLELILKLYR